MEENDKKKGMFKAYQIAQEMIKDRLEDVDKEAAKERKLTKLLAAKESEARDAQLEAKRLVEEDEKRAADEAAAAAEAAKAEREAAEAAKAEKEAKRKEEEDAKRKEAEAFEAKVRARRSRTNSMGVAGAVDVA